MSLRAPLAVGIFMTLASGVFAQVVLSDREERVIRYEASDDLADPVHTLEQRLTRGQAKLESKGEQGYLASLLQLLQIPLTSQALVFSKTSFQAKLINPQTPRALYFNDSVYVGWVPGSDVIEVNAIDPHKGPIFYTLEQKGPPHFQRREECMRCHFSLKTMGVPGQLMHSMLTAPDGAALRQVADFVDGHRSPLSARWGGWYVTGSHPGDHHLGADLTGVNTARYLAADSDLVALTVFAHQVRMHNLITHLSYETRLAIDQSGPSEWTRKRIANSAEQLLTYMLYRDEAPFKGPISGPTSFAKDFAKRGPFDSKGRSLRQLDLTTRLQRYPCSFLIYSEAFDGLPPEAKGYLWPRLFEILSGRDKSETYAAMNPADRLAVLEILRDTKPEFAAWLVKSQRAEVVASHPIR